MHHPLTVNVPEVLFNPVPALAELKFDDVTRMFPALDNFEGITHHVRETVMACDVECRDEVLNNILISGGSTKIPGFTERLARDLFSDSVIRRLSKPRIHQETFLKEKDYATFTGASILSSLSSFQNLWITKSDYQEAGETVINRAFR